MLLDAIKPTAIVYDLDGFVIDSSVRAIKYIDREAKERGDYFAYETSVWRYALSDEDDTPIDFGIDMMNALRFALAPDAMIALTSRNESERAHTLDCMKRWLPWTVSDDLLYMSATKRVSDCGTKLEVPEVWFDHVIYKRAQLRKIQETYKVMLAGDDHPAVVEMFHQEGVNAIRGLWADVNCLFLFGEPQAKLEERGAK
jgi:hypothetical protein